MVIVEKAKSAMVVYR